VRRTSGRPKSIPRQAVAPRSRGHARSTSARGARAGARRRPLFRVIRLHWPCGTVALTDPQGRAHSAGHHESTCDGGSTDAGNGTTQSHNTSQGRPCRESRAGCTPLRDTHGEFDARGAREFMPSWRTCAASMGRTSRCSRARTRWRRSRHSRSRNCLGVPAPRKRTRARRGRSTCRACSTRATRSRGCSRHTRGMTPTSSSSCSRGRRWRTR